jgi:hypothetical protein
MTNGALEKLLIETGGKITGETEEADRQRIVKYWFIRALNDGLENTIKTWAEHVRKMGYN